MTRFCINIEGRQLLRWLAAFALGTVLAQRELLAWIFAR